MNSITDCLMKAVNILGRKILELEGMRVATVDGLVTLFYDGSKKLYNQELLIEWLRACHYKEDTDIESLDLSDECRSYLRERFSWQQIIVVDGVTEIPEDTFFRFINIKRVIFADSVIRIQASAFYRCKKLVSVKWPLRLEFIGESVFEGCNLSSVFIPPRCREIGNFAFACNKNLKILNIPQDAELETKIISETAIAKTSPIRTDANGWYDNGEVSDSINEWLQQINNDENFALHRACASFNPLIEVIHAIILQKGLKAFRVENSAGITPSRYLQENPYTDLTEKQIIHDYLMKMMGEVE